MCFASALIHCLVSLGEVGSFSSEELQTYNNMYGKELVENIVAGEGEGVVPRWPCTYRNPRQDSVYTSADYLPYAYKRAPLPPPVPAQTDHC